MRLLLIRHGETVHNVAGVYAGITDSALTNHGVFQANRLGTHLAETGVKITHIFSSDLQRAVKTADAIRDAQSRTPPEITKLELLREQDFGFYEMKKFFQRPQDSSGTTGKDGHLEAHRNDPGFQDIESKESMKLRMDSFVDIHLVQLLVDVEDGHTVVIVAHGIILSHLWRAILKRFNPGNVSVTPGIPAAERGFSLEYLGGWSNTGYMDLEVKKNDAALTTIPAKTSPSNSVSSVLPSANESSTATRAKQPTDLSSNTASTMIRHISVVVKAVNSQEHLKGLKKTRGGIGSLKHDSSQKTVDSFFKKRRLE